jgi:hypothetical protein
VLQEEDLQGLTPKPKITPRKKMRPMFITKLKIPEVVESIWKDVEEPEIDTELLESGFADEVSWKTVLTAAVVIDVRLIVLSCVCACVYTYIHI